MMDMAAKINTLWPEIVLTAVAFLVMILGLSRSEATRRATLWISMLGLGAAGVIALLDIGQVTSIALFVKVSTVLIGLALLLVAADLPDESGTEPAANLRGRGFDPALTTRGEFYGLLLLSLVGAMLCAGADDMVWLFLALELTSLPTYVLVSVSRQDIRAPEAGVKYFFLGAVAAAVFLYGFALIYAGTGTTYLGEIQEAIAADGLNGLTLLGMLLAVIGVGFKIAAFPMHFYAADVYEGASTPVATFLAYVPKAAGFVTLILLLQATGWGDDTLTLVLWTMAVLTMFIGNTLALRQTNVKRVLAYSSIAHSGYMLVGLVAGPGANGHAGNSLWISNGVAAVLFYLVAYGVMNLGAFAVLGILRRGGEEAETFDDLRGLVHRRPGLAVVMAICVLSLTGIPPFIGFFGKLFLIGAAISGGFYLLAALTVLNSAIAAYYYLRIFGACFLYDASPTAHPTPSPSRTWAAAVSAIAIVLLSIFVTSLVSASLDAARGEESRVSDQESVAENVYYVGD